MHSTSDGGDTPHLDPQALRAALTAPSPSYKRHAWLALCALLTFVAVYGGLVVYLADVMRRLVRSFGWGAAFVGLPVLFFLGFLARGLVLVKHREDPSRVEVTSATQPRLFEFLYALADSIGAPRPHKVYLTTAVNAAVFYDLSFLGFFFPTKKNLEIGLGLVDALTRDEFEAVLAHEFGHFAQRSMAVGRWVYVAQQIASHVVYARSGFDTVLRWISGIDLRIAWIGWLMRLWVWAIRALLESFFTLTTLAHRALSREMEFQADRVAVSVRGSDSLIHALHRLGPADDAWVQAADFVAREERAGRPVADLVAVQGAIVEHMRVVLGRPSYGRSPVVPERDRSAFRVFTDDLAAPPVMWSTHPSNRDREASAKQIYVPSVFDAASAWTLFDDAASLRTQTTERFRAQLRRDAKGQPPDASALPAAVPIGKSLDAVTEDFAVPALSPSFRGAYVGRELAARAGSAADLVGPRSLDDTEVLRARLDGLYPPSLADDVAKTRELKDELRALEGLEAGILTAPGGVLRYRGRELRRAELPRVVEAARAEATAAAATLDAHDRTVRAAHLDAATRVGGRWDEALLGLLELVHFGTQTARNLEDALGAFHNVLSVVLADGNVSSSERTRLLASARDVHEALSEAHRHTPSVGLPEPVQHRLDRRKALDGLMKGLQLNPPDDQNLPDWVNVVDGHVVVASSGFRALADEAFDVLLESEELVAGHLRSGQAPPEPPLGARVPARYTTCLEGAGRPRQTKLGWWDRFQVADGIVPGALRFGVAVALLAPVVILEREAPEATLHVVNGYARPLVVVIDGVRHDVRPRAHARFEVPAERRFELVAQTSAGEVVSRLTTPELDRTSAYVFNPGAAEVVFRWYQSYGRVEEREPEFPAPEVFQVVPSSVEAAFEEPPASRRSQGHALVLDVLPRDLPPAQRMGTQSSLSAADALVATHVRFEPSGSRALRAWLELSRVGPKGVEALARRADAAPDDLDLALALEHQLTGEARRAHCASVATRVAAQPRSVAGGQLTLVCASTTEARAAALDSVCARWRDEPELVSQCADALAVAGDLPAAHAMLAPAYGRATRSSNLDVALYSTLMRVEQLASARGLEGLDVPARPEDAPPPLGYARFAFALAPGYEGPLADEPTVRAMRALESGDLTAATQQSGRLPDREDVQLLEALLALSSGADDAARRRSHTTPLDRLPSPVGLGLLGIRLHDGVALSAELAQLDSGLPVPIADGLARCLEAERSGLRGCVEALAAHAPLRLQGGLALLLHGLDPASTDAARARVLATHLLAGERPFVTAN